MTAPDPSPPPRRPSDGAAALTGARIAVLVVGGLSSVLVGRFLGPEEYGLFSTGLAVSGIALLFGPMGVDQLQIFHAVELDAARRLMTRVALLTLGLVVVLAAAWPGIGEVARWCTLVVGAANVGRLMLVPWLTDPQRRLEFRLRARRELLLTLTTTVCFVAAAAVTGRALVVCFAAVVAHLALLVASGSFHLRRPAAAAAATIRQALPYALSSALYTVYFTLDSSILAALRPDVEVGQYAAAYLPLTAVSAVAIVLNSDILRSRLAREYTGDLSATSAGSFLRVSFATGVVGALGLALLGPVAIGVLFGDGFDQASRLVPILALTVVPHFVATWASSTLIAVGRVSRVLRSQAVLCVVNLVANLVFVPSFGAFAAAWVTVATEALGATFYCVLVARARRAGAPA